MANRYFVVGGVDTNWGTIGNWSLTSGGAGGQAVPLATDDVFFDGNSGSTCTLNTSVRVAKTLNTTGYSGGLVFTWQLSVSGSITIGTGTTFSGAAKLRMIAAGTWTTNGVTIPQPVEIGGSTAFTCTLGGALAFSSTLELTNSTSTTFAGDFAFTFGNCTISGGQTVNIIRTMTCTGTTTMSTDTVINGAFDWETAGLSLGAYDLSGTTTFVLTGGTLSGAAGILSSSIRFAGDSTVSGTLLKAGTGSITRTSGTITTTGSTLSIGASCTMDTAGMTWNIVLLTAAVTLTFNSILYAATFTAPNAAMTLAGSFGFVVGTFTNTTITATRIYTFQNGVEYVIQTYFNPIHAAAQTVRFTIASNHASIKAKITLGPGAAQDLGFTDPTRIDSSGGQTIYSFHGVITDCFNWISAYPVNAALNDPIVQVGL